MTRWLRNLSYLSAITLALPWLLWRSFKTGRYRAGLHQKFFGLGVVTSLDNTSTQIKRSAQRIWLHGVSVGEIQLLGPLLDRLRDEFPEASFFVSTTTDSGMELARKHMPSGVCIFYLPLDFSWSVAKTLKTVQPDLIVLGELELWPNLIDAASSRGIPIAVINGRLSARSHAGYQRFYWLTRPMFAKLSLVAAQSEADAERFRNCGAQRHTVVTGSIKFDNVAFDRAHPEVEKLRQLVGLNSTHRVLVVGSTQAPEELAALRAWQTLREHFPLLKLIVVPRHPERFDSVYTGLQTPGVRALRRSQLTTPVAAADWDVLLVDTVGELKWWWGLAEIAIVGGSFGARGGQNMLEPAAYGANVAFGPNTSNFRDIVAILLAGGAAQCIPSLEAMPQWLRTQLQFPEPGRMRGQRAAAIVAHQQGALQRTVEHLQRLL